MLKKFALNIYIVIFSILVNSFSSSAQVSLAITNPLPVCSPATIDITAASITAGSTLPAGTTLSYFADAATTIVLPAPIAITNSGTYYIKATNAGLSDVKPVIVTILPTPVLIIENPAAVCSPSTVDITNPSIAINNSSLPPNTVFNYCEDAACIILIPNPEVIATTGIYYIKATVSVTSCYNIAPIPVTIYVQPVAPIVSVLTYCQFRLQQYQVKQHIIQVRLCQMVVKV
jgi:hypothetical protein